LADEGPNGVMVFRMHFVVFFVVCFAFVPQEAPKGKILSCMSSLMEKSLLETLFVLGSSYPRKTKNNNSLSARDFDFHSNALFDLF
jgi:hypothetical protein